MFSPFVFCFCCGARRRGFLFFCFRPRCGEAGSWWPTGFCFDQIQLQLCSSANNMGEILYETGLLKVTAVVKEFASKMIPLSSLRV